MGEMILATMGEMSLKGLNRRSFEKILLKTLRQRTAGCGNWAVQTAQSAIYMLPEDDTAAASFETVFSRVEKVFGIATLYRATTCDKTLDDICRTAASYLAGQLNAAKTFRVTSKRADKKFPLNSLEINREVGGYLLESFPHLQVDVHNPDVTVGVQVRENYAYLHGSKLRGAGGLPVPCSGRAILLLSGGIDSPVAAWLMAKRGLALVPVHFASPPYTSPRAAAKVEALADILANWCGPLPYHYVPYTETQVYLRDNLPRQDYFTVLMRRSMLRIANIIAEKEGCDAIVTGESLAQVASQTLLALACTDAAQPLPILRPCIGMDKTEITDIARHIGSFETSIQPYEDCCTIFSPPHPKTQPKLDEVLALEAALPELPRLEAEAAAQAEFSLRMPNN